MKSAGLIFGVVLLFFCSCKPWIVVNYPPLPTAISATIDSATFGDAKPLPPINPEPTVIYLQSAPDNQRGAPITVVHEVTKDAFRVLELAYLKGTLDSSTFVSLYKEVLSTAKHLISEEIELEEAREATILAKVEKLKLELKKLNGTLEAENSSLEKKVEAEE